jgi:hypothetical protein
VRNPGCDSLPSIPPAESHHHDIAKAHKNQAEKAEIRYEVRGDGREDSGREIVSRVYLYKLEAPGRSNYAGTNLRSGTINGGRSPGWTK